MNTMHDSNRRYWDGAAADWERLSDAGGLWQRCAREPDLGFAGGALELIREFGGDLSGKDVCVVGSGDNYAAFALSGMGANVTSIDISERRLEMASKRAERLDLPITFAQADAADLTPVGDAEFDLVFSSNGFFVWISDLHPVFSEILSYPASGRTLRLLRYPSVPAALERPDQDRSRPGSPIGRPGRSKAMKTTGSFEFHWTLAEILNPLTASGLILRRILESPAKDSRYWQGRSYLPGTDESLLDWNENPPGGTAGMARSSSPEAIAMRE